MGSVLTSFFKLTVRAIGEPPFGVGGKGRPKVHLFEGGSYFSGAQMEHLPVGQADEGFADGVRHQNERVRIVGGINVQPVTHGSGRKVGDERGKRGIVLLGGAPIFDGLGHCVGKGFG